MSYKKSLLFQGKSIQLEICPLSPLSPQPIKTSSHDHLHLRVRSNSPLSPIEQNSLHEYLKNEGYIEEALHHNQPP